ncbi:hypothetical protein DFJ73DRAFT_879507 [Zopfochytrium polystomum]|nr:hypothetical protein DFJ73DRAFT_879507 [Zopfochytrium polystomum]
MHLDYPQPSSAQPLDASTNAPPSGSESYAEESPSFYSPSMASPPTEKAERAAGWPEGNQPAHPSMKLDYPPSSYMQQSARPLSNSLSYNPSNNSDSTALIGGNQFTFPPPMVLDDSKFVSQGQEKRKGISRLWVAVIIVGAIVLAAIIIAVAVIVSNSNNSQSPATTVTKTTALASSQRSSTLTSSSAPSSAASSTQDPTQQTTTQNPPPAQTTQQQQPTTTAQPAQNKFQIRHSGTNDCIASSAYAACESNPGSSSPQVFVENGQLWKQLSSGMCISIYGFKLSLQPCDQYDHFQLMYWVNNQIQSLSGSCFKGDLSSFGMENCGTFDRLSVA